MAAVLGLNCRLFIQSDGVAGSNGWTEMTNVRDLAVNLDSERADVTTRGNNGFRAEIGTLKNGSITFDAVFDTADAVFTALQAAFFANSLVGVRALTGDPAAQATQGLVADMAVVNFSQTQNLADAVTVSIELSPTLSATAATYVTEGPDYTP